MNKNNTDKNDIGRRFRVVRKYLCLSQSDLAMEMGVDKSVVGNIERGRHYPGFQYLIYLNRKYNINLNWLTVGTGKMLNTNPPAVPEKFRELLDLMALPDMEFLIMGRFQEAKHMLQEQVETFKEQKEQAELKN